MKNWKLFVLLLLGSCGPDPIPDPEPVNLVAPENLNSCTTASRISDTESQVNFQWTAALHADNYELIVQNTLTQEQLNTSTSLQNASLTLPSGAPYIWFVRSKSTLTPVETDSSTWQFYLEGSTSATHFPFPALLQSPEDESEIVLSAQGTFQFEWEGNDLDNDIVSYDLYLSTDPDEFALVKDGITSSQTLLELNSNTLYYWQVATRDENQNQSFSEVFSFQTE